MSLLSDVLFSERLARQGPSSIVILPLPLVCQSHSHFQCLRKQHSGAVRTTSLSLSSLLKSPIICSELLQHHRVISPAVGRKQEARALHSQVDMTGAALLGRRWADRLCRDRTVSLLV